MKVTRKLKERYIIKEVQTKDCVEYYIRDEYEDVLEEEKPLWKRFFSEKIILLCIFGMALCVWNICSTDYKLIAAINGCAFAINARTAIKYYKKIKNNHH